MRRKIIDKGIRPDGRKLTEVRPIWCEVGLLPRAHGSAVFTRGQTQVMTVATLGSMSEAQMLDGIVHRGLQALHAPLQHAPLLHRRGAAHALPGRREIGHGALAERALEPVIPSRRSSPTPSAWSARSSPPTAPPPRPPSAAPPWR